MGAGPNTPENLLARAVVENTNEAIVLLECIPGQLRIAYVNAAFTTQMGYEPEEVVGRPPQDLITAAVAPDGVDAIFRAAAAGERIRTEIANRTKDGREIWLDVNLLPLRDEAGAVTHFLSFRRDITEAKEREAALLEACERYRTVMNACLDAFFLLEPVRGDDGELDYKVIEANSHAVEALGLQEGALVRRDRASFDQILTAEEILSGFESVALTGFPVEGVLSLEGGVWIRYQLLRVGRCVAVVTRDMSEVRRSQQKIVEAEAWLRDAIESIDQGLVLYDADDALITCNQHFKCLHTANAEALVPGNRYETIIRAAIARGYLDVGDDVEAWVSARLQERRSNAERSYVQERSDGRVLRIDEKRTQNGGLVAIHADITAAKQREQLLREAKEQAEAANLSKSQFLATMSHELRTPLNAIIGFSEILQQGVFGALEGKHLEYVGDINNAGCHLLALINDVLDMAKIEAGKYVLTDEATHLSDLIGECLRQISHQAESGGLRIEYRPEPQLCPVQADRRALKQILLNLLSNAVKFTPAGGAITVAVGRSPEGLAISVTDTGIGIPPDDMQRILRPFEQVESTNNRQHNGTGLGLSITRRLIELHGGTLQIQSPAGRGTCATVTLPVPRLLPTAHSARTA